jgi:predicted RNase H-like HicB family nuclease
MPNKEEMSTQYSYYISWSPADQEFVARFLELPGLSGMGATMPEAIAELNVAFGGWLELAREKKFELPKPVQASSSKFPLVIVDNTCIAENAKISTTVLPGWMRVKKRDDGHRTASGFAATADFPDEEELRA